MSESFSAKPRRNAVAASSSPGTALSRSDMCLAVSVKRTILSTRSTTRFRMSGDKDSRKLACGSSINFSKTEAGLLPEAASGACFAGSWQCFVCHEEDPRPGRGRDRTNAATIAQSCRTGSRHRCLKEPSSQVSRCMSWNLSTTSWLSREESLGDALSTASAKFWSFKAVRPSCAATFRRLATAKVAKGNSTKLHSLTELNCTKGVASLQLTGSTL
mmetsp:Transcript_254/g.505  ORF Transcript_254/g.505 Transcript_254/m.505 type:complete len:216 (+) Transcript_254:835-1482(+)